MNLVVADRDESYLERFADYYRSSEYKERFILKSFTRKESLLSFMEVETTRCIVLSRPELLPDLSICGPHCRIFYLVELEDGSDASTLEGIACPFIYKYQPLNALISQLLAALAGETDSGVVKRPSGKRSGRVISVYSGAGGSGKTTTAVNLAKQLATRDEKVFYFNLERFHSSYAWLPESDVSDLQQIVYYLKTKPEQIASKFEAVRKHDPWTKVDYLGLSFHNREMLELTKDDVCRFIDAVVETKIYDTMVIDLESSCHERILGALQASDLIVWLMTDDLPCLIKTKQSMHVLAQSFDEPVEHFSSRSRFVFNKFTGEVSNRCDQPISGYLPYVPQWKAISRKEDWLSSGIFNEQLMRLYDRLTESGEVAAIGS